MHFPPFVPILIVPAVVIAIAIAVVVACHLSSLLHVTVVVVD
jgi:hypothetical protein